MYYHILSDYIRYINLSQFHSWNVHLHQPKVSSQAPVPPPVVSPCSARQSVACRYHQPRHSVSSARPRVSS